MNLTLRPTNGFTILELIMTMVIITILSALALPFATNLYNRSRIDDAATGLMEALQRAQSGSAGQKDRGRYSVSLQSDRYVYFPGNIYNASNIENEVSTLPATITLSWSLNGGGSVVTFNPGNGKTSTYGTATLTDQTGVIIVIVIDQNGQVYVQ